VGGFGYLEFGCSLRAAQRESSHTQHTGLQNRTTGTVRLKGMQSNVHS
jgi:hypothetical protein